MSVLWSEQHASVLGGKTTENPSWLLPVQKEYRHLKVSAINKDCL